MARITPPRRVPALPAGRAGRGGVARQQRESNRRRWGGPHDAPDVQGRWRRPLTI